MSYIICGEFILNKKYLNEDKERLAWLLNNEATTNNLYVLMQCNISQSLVFEIFKVNKLAMKKMNLSFFITNNPILDTSDSLISPYVIGLKKSNYIACLKLNMRKLYNYFNSLFKKNIVDNIIIVFSEGYDSIYENIELDIDNFIEIVSSKCKIDNDIPSMKIMINKKGL